MGSITMEFVSIVKFSSINGLVKSQSYGSQLVYEKGISLIKRLNWVTELKMKLWKLHSLEGGCWDEMLPLMEHMSWRYNYWNLLTTLYFLRINICMTNVGYVYDQTLLAIFFKIIHFNHLTYNPKKKKSFVQYIDTREKHK